MPVPATNRNPLDCDHKVETDWETGIRQCVKCGLVFDDEETFE